MRILKLTLLLTFLCNIPIHLDAQRLLNGVLKRTGDKVRYGAERMLIEKASDALSRAIMRKAEQELDKVMRDAFEKQRQEAEENGETPEYGDYSGFLKSMNKAADLPPSYELDLQMYCTVSSRKEKPQDVVYQFSRGGGYFAFESEADGKKSMMLIDVEKDLIVMYIDENGKKTATALPGMMSLGAAMAEKHVKDSVDENMGSLKATGNSKEVAGYNCKEYEYLYEKEKALSYTTTELDFNWPLVFGKMLERFMPDSEEFPAEAFQGMTLENITFDKKGREDTKWTTNKVTFDKITIDNSEWEFQDFTTMSEME